jgi:hypothetical protein
MDRLQIVTECYAAFAAGDRDAFEAHLATRTDGTRFRNTEILGFDGDDVTQVEVDFGWDVP